MRPSDDPRRLIERLTREGVGDAAHALWFGSRTDGTRRGRDIDLRGESPQPLADRFGPELRLGWRRR
jgi:hypothetical protein